MTRARLLIAATLGAWALLSYLWYPGHTWLRQDSQIYVALFEHLDNPTVLARDLMCVHPHLQWTLYDEIARGLHAVTHLSYHVVLDAQMLVFRWLALIGIYLLARRAGLAQLGALFAAFVFGLGSFAAGPEVMTVELEPVPRGFALALVLAALGCAVSNRWKLSAALAGVAILYHAPTAAPYWLAVFVLLVLSKDRSAWKPLACSFAAAAVALIAGAYWQAGEREVQPLFARVPDDLIALLRFRGAYLWVDIWARMWPYYAVLTVIAALAWRRVRPLMTREVAVISATLIAYGALSIPLSWLLLNQLRWTMMTQFQPARAVLFLMIFTIVLCCCAAGNAANLGRRWECAAWLVPVLLLPANVPQLVGVLLEVAGFRSMALFIIVGTLALAILAARLLSRRNQLSLAVLAVPLIVSALLLVLSTFVPSRRMEIVAMRDLTNWASSHTAPNAMFQFANTAHSTLPGVFRIDAQRALYADWKGGGQVNQSFAFAREWQRRWSDVHQAEEPLPSAGAYRALGIDYVVVRDDRAKLSAPVVFRTYRWLVYDVRR